MELKIKERIILIIYYLLLAAGVIWFFVWILVEVEHGEVIAGLLVYPLLALWFEARSIIERIRASEFRKKHEIYCNSCKYRKENDKL